MNDLTLKTRIAQIFERLNNRVEGINTGLKIRDKIESYILSLKDFPEKQKENCQVYTLLQQDKPSKDYYLTEEQWLMVEQIKNQEGQVNKMKKSTFDTKLIKSEQQTDLENLLEENKTKYPLLTSINSRIDLIAVLQKRTSHAVLKTQINREKIQADIFSWNLAKNIHEAEYNSLNEKYALKDTVPFEEGVYQQLTYILSKNTIYDLFLDLNLFKSYSKYIRIVQGQQTILNYTIPRFSERDSLPLLFLHAMVCLEDSTMPGQGKDKEKTKRTLTLKPTAPNFLEDYLKNKDTTLTQLRKILIEGLNIYYRLLANEILELLETANYIELFSETIEISPGFIKTPYIIQFKTAIMVFIKRQIPQILPNALANTTITEMPDANLDLNAFGYKRNKNVSIKTTKHHKKLRKDAKYDYKQEDKIKELFSAAITLDLSFVYNWLETFEKLFTLPLEEILTNDYYLRFLSELYGINFNSLLKDPQVVDLMIPIMEEDNLLASDIPLKATIMERLKNIINYAIKFDLMGLFEYGHLHRTYQVQKEYNAKLDLRKNYLLYIIYKIESQKFLINEIFVNLVVLLNFKNFYNNYFSCFRGRVYPYGIFNYLLPLTRYMIRFDFDAPEHLADKNNNNLPLLEQQLRALLKTNTDYFLQKNALINLNLDIIYPHIPFGKLFEARKFLEDYSKVKLEKPVPYSATGSFDCSGSGAQINVNLLKFRYLAEKTCLIGNGEDMYTAIKKSIYALTGGSQQLLDQLKKQLAPLLELFPITPETRGNSLAISDSILQKLSRPISLELVNALGILSEPSGMVYYKLYQGLITEFSSLMDDKLNYILKDVGHGLGITLADCETYFDEFRPWSENFKEQTAARKANSKKEETVRADICKPTRVDKFPIITEIDFPIESVIPLRMRLFLTIYVVLLFNSVTYNFYLLTTYPVERSTVKHAAMCHWYGSSSTTKARQISDYYIETALKNGVWLSVKRLYDIQKHSNFLTKLILRVLMQDYGDMAILLRTVKYLCDTKRFIIPNVETEYFYYYYQPLMQNRFKQRISKKTYWMLTTTDDIDYKKLRSSTVANYIQHLDAQLLYIFLDKVKDYCKINKIKKMPLFILHDRYFIHPHYLAILKPLLKEAYITFFEKDYLKQHFRDNPRVFEQITKAKNRLEGKSKKSKNAEKSEKSVALEEFKESVEFSVEDLKSNMHPDFVKH